MSGTYWIGGWAGRRPGLDAVQKRKIFQGIDKGPYSPVARRYTD
jgi:hypothetical protein